MQPRHLHAALGFGLATSLVIAPRVSSAQANYDAALIGGRSSLMGGTGVAGGMDAAAPLQNPATTVDIAGTSFVFSTMFLQLAIRKSAATLPEAPASADFSQTQFGLLPNSTCIFTDLAGTPGRRAGRHKLSICFSQPESEDFNLNARALAEGTNTFYQNRHVAQTFNKRVYVAGWAYGLSEYLSVGVTPMIQEVNFVDNEVIGTLTAATSSADDLIGAAGMNSTTYTNRQGNSFAGSVLLGVQFIPRPGWQMGLSLETPSFAFAGNYRSVRSSEAVGNSSEQYMQERGSLRVQYPLRAAFGVAGELPWFSFEANAYVHTARGDFAQVTSTRELVSFDSDVVVGRDSSDQTYSESVRPVINMGAGINVPVEPEWAMVFGVLTDFSGLPSRVRGSAEEVIFRSRRDRVHASVGVAWTPPGGSLLLGVRGYMGQGELALSSAITSDATRGVVREDQWGLALVLSGQLSLEMFARIDPTGLVPKPQAKPPEAKAPQAK